MDPVFELNVVISSTTNAYLKRLKQDGSVQEFCLISVFAHFVMYGLMHLSSLSYLKFSKNRKN
jgi:hypothetical protein